MHTIIKYKNRKMYSEKLKRYVNLREIPGFFTNNDQIKVIDKQTGTDITNTIVSKLLSVVTVDTQFAIELIKRACKNSTTIV